jgi:hypothetical protein
MTVRASLTVSRQMAHLSSDWIAATGLRSLAGAAFAAAAADDDDDPELPGGHRRGLRWSSYSVRPSSLAGSTHSDVSWQGGGGAAVVVGGGEWCEADGSPCGAGSGGRLAGAAASSAWT